MSNGLVKEEYERFQKSNIYEVNITKPLMDFYHYVYEKGIHDLQKK